MNEKVLTGGRVLIGDSLVADKAIHISGGRIIAIGEEAAVDPAVERVDVGGRIVLPGFVDLQVNGGGGQLFNADPSVASIRQIAHTHARFGTTALLPTFISDDLEKVAIAIAAVEEAIAQGVPGVIGIHIEGPFLSTDRKGVHDETKFRDFLPEHVDLMSSLPNGRTMVTLSPERAAPGVIESLVARGVIVAAGHTNADYRTMRAALDAGVSGFTHLFNAMSPLTSREPGVVGAALEDQSSWCGIIVDGHHVSPVTLQLAMRCKPAEKFVLVTDAMPSVGMNEGSFVLQGRHIHVEDGICRADDGTLAGSDLDMARAVRNAITLLGVDLSQASAMASANPAAFIGMGSQIGAIREGSRADFVVLDDALEVRSTWIAGECIHG